MQVVKTGHDMPALTHYFKVPYLNLSKCKLVCRVQIRVLQVFVQLGLTLCHVYIDSILTFPRHPLNLLIILHNVRN